MKRKTLSKIYKVKNQIPNWIDTTLKLHYKIWNTMLDCNNIIVHNLIIDVILDIEEIDYIIDIFDETINKVLNLGYDLEIAVYYEVFLMWLEEQLLNIEAYEALSNLKQIKDRYFNIKYDGFQNE